MRHLLIIGFFICFCSQVKAVEDTTVTIGDSAQMTVVDSVEIDPGLKMDSVFRTLDAQYMTTNRLIDRSIAFIDYASYQGHLADSNKMTYGKLLRLNGAMLMAIHDTPAQYTVTDTVKHWYHHYDSLGYQPFALLNMAYDKLKDSALADSLIYKDGIQVKNRHKMQESRF